MWNSIGFQAISFVIHTLSFCKGGHGFLFWGLIVLNSDSVCSHNWRFPSPLAHPCQFRPYLWNSTWLFSYLPLFIVCHVKTDSLVSAAPDLWLELNMEKSWLDFGAGEVGQGWLGSREETFLRTLSLYSYWGQSCPKWGTTWLVKLGAQNTKLFIYEAQIYRVSMVVKFHDD